MAKIRLGKTKDSRTRRKSIDNKEEVRLLQRLQHEKDQPEFIQCLLKKGYSIKSSERYQKDILRFKKWLEQENLSEEAVGYNDITFYIQSLKGQVKQITIQSILASLKQYYQYLQDLNLIKENPVYNVEIKGIKRKILHRILSKQELEKTYHDYKQLQSETSSKKRNEIIVSLLIYQGLTTTDIKSLLVDDVKLREGVIYIKGNLKSNDRTLKLESHQILDFMEYQLKIRSEILQASKKETDLFFVSTGTSLALGNVMQKLIQQVRKQNPNVESVKQIRASVITHWLKQYNLRETQYMAGHRYVSSTESYMINDLEDLQDDIEKYHPFN